MTAGGSPPFHPGPAAPAPPGRGAARPSRSHLFPLLLALLALAAGGALARPGFAAEAAAPAIVVFPFEAERPNDRWLAGFLADGLRDSLRFSGTREPLAGEEQGALWAQKWGLAGLEAPTAGQMAAGGFSMAVQGTVQEVLNLVSVRLLRTGGPGAGKELAFSLNLEADTPEAALRRLLAVFPPRKKGEPPLRPAPQPQSWAAAREFQLLARSAPPAGQGDALERHLSYLEAAGRDPVLRGRTAHLAAELTLRRAVLEATPAAEKKRKMAVALRHLNAALAADPWQSDWLALKGEIQYFLRRDFEARTDASVARLKNPRNGLAFFVMALAAGLSTGEAAEMIPKALAADPFLAQENRPPGAPPFQEGALEPKLQQWRRLREIARKRREETVSPGLANAIKQFEAGRWGEAEYALRELLKKEEDYRNELYLGRILIQTERSAEAVRMLETLGVEYPQEPEIFYFLGIGLQRTGEYVEAEKAFRRSLRENPDEPRYLYGLATAEVALEKWEEARGVLQELLAREPRHEQGWLAYGIVHYNLEEWPAAEEAFEKVLALNPESADGRLWRSRTRPRLPN